MQDAGCQTRGRDKEYNEDSALIMIQVCTIGCCRCRRKRRAQSLCCRVTWARRRS